MYLGHGHAMIPTMNAQHMVMHQRYVMAQSQQQQLQRRQLLAASIRRLKWCWHPLVNTSKFTDAAHLNVAKAVISDTNKTISNETKGMSSGESDVTSKTGTTHDVENESSKDDGKDKSSWADLINMPGRPAGHKPSALERRVDALQSQLEAHHQLQNDREKKLTAIPVDGSAGVGLQYSLNGGTTTLLLPRLLLLVLWLFPLLLMVIRLVLSVLKLVLSVLKLVLSVLKLVLSVVNLVLSVV